ncbi:MAG: DUF4388 domain-containing protein [Deltaproteobacteria bacterium]
MQGKISDFSIPEIFQLVANQGKSGSLTIRGGDRESVFIFADGGIIEVQPDRRARSDLLGSMLVDAGFLTDGELRRILAKQERAGKKLGELLVEKEIVSMDVLARYLRLQVKEGVFEILKLKDGDYQFEGFAVRLPPWIKTPIRADVLMMEGMQFLDEATRYRAKFPPGAFRVFRKRGAKIDEDALPAEERAVWNAIEFSDVPLRIFRKACVTWVEGIKGLWLLMDRGLIDVGVVEVEEVQADPGRAVRKDIARARVLGVVRALLWASAAVVAAGWIYFILLSPRATGAFTGWAGFF